MFGNKKQFPLFKGQRKLVYLDSASTTQICAPALTAVENFHKKSRANVHRGLYPLSVNATEQYEAARDSVANFINADRTEIIFTSGTTMALNQLAHSLSPRLSHRDNIVLTRLEHHANLVPWQQMAKHYGFTIRFIELKNGELDLVSAAKIIDANTKVVSFALASNVLGTIAPAQKIIALAKQVHATTIIDAAQTVAYMPIDVRALDCDYLAFSGHKMYGPTGIGVLYGKKINLEEHLEPFFFGGEMVRSVSYDSATWNDVPHKFEAGTPNIAGAIGLGAAVKFIQKIGWQKIQAHEQALKEYALQKLASEVTIVEPQADRLGIIAFTVSGVHPHDVAELLGEKNICVRAGTHCAEPLHHLYNLNATVRMSLGFYNDKKDIDALVAALKQTKKVFA